ncbi:MAG: 2-amino-4-hydroxy-6-hydroxymethyldihydropteridine diphosphokinase [Runella sp.]
MRQNPVYLLLGGNLGHREATLQQARKLIESRIAPIEVASQVYETAPWGVTDQPSFLNQVLMLRTHLHPIDILELVQKIEQYLGRERRERWGAREIDVDILFYGELILQMPDLVIPHPRLQERRFTLLPLVEIAPTFIHPKFKKTISELLAECIDDSKVNVYNESNS